MLEFGVASGRLITTIAEQTPGPVYGFDSCEGFPNPGSANMRGHLCASPATAAPSNITLFKG